MMIGAGVLHRDRQARWLAPGTDDLDRKGGHESSTIDPVWRRRWMDRMGIQFLDPQIEAALGGVLELHRQCRVYENTQSILSRSASQIHEI